MNYGFLTCPNSFLAPSSCDKVTVNSSSQTAYDIAKFWGHKHIADLLGRAGDGCRPDSHISPQENYFSREPLDRSSGKRSDEAWLEAKGRKPDTVYLLFSNLSPMVSTAQDHSGAAVRSQPQPTAAFTDAT